MRRLSMLALLVVVLTTSARAQSDDQALVSRFQVAESHLRAGQFDRAIPLLEQLYESDPQSFLFYDRLKTAYESVKRYDDAIDLIDQRLREERTPVLLAEMGRIQFLNGDEQAAYGFWEAAVDTAPTTRSTYQVVYRSMIDVRQLDRAIEVLLTARDRTGDESGFRSDLAALYWMVGRYDEAMSEQLGMLSEDQRYLSSIISSLSRQSEQPEAIAAAREATEVAVRKDPLNRGFRELLSWIYLESGDYESALNESRAIDRLEKQEGRVLLGFAQKALHAEAFEAGASAYRDIVERYPSSASAPHAIFGLGVLYEAWAASIKEAGATPDEVNDRLRLALEAYDELADDHRDHPFYPQVLRSRGHLQLDVLRDLDAAEQTLTEVTRRFEGSDEADEALFDLARIDVLRGDLESGMLRFSRIVDHLRIGDLAESARFEMARIHFYRGELQSARTLIDVLDVNTSTDVANDALELKVIIIDNSGPDSLNVPLSRFAEAKLLMRQHRQDEALEQLEGILAEFTRHKIVDEVRFARAEVLRAQGEYTQAMESYTEVAAFHPESHLADRSLYDAALLQERYLDDSQGAIETLTRLLADHPGSPLTQIARQQVRRIRGDAL